MDQLCVTSVASQVVLFAGIFHDVLEISQRFPAAMMNHRSPLDVSATFLARRLPVVALTLILGERC